MVNQREQLRTAIEQIGELDLQAIGKECEKKAIDLEPLEIQIQHDEAFDVEKVTDRFFSEYKLVFESVEGSIEGIKDTEQKRLFTQKLFNRLMFIAFVQKKGWLEFNGSQDYFKALWQDWKESPNPLGKGAMSGAGNFYRARLSHLFFAGLNDPDKQGDKKLIKLIGNVPYLNGGLFEEDASEMVPGIVVPDRAIEDILTKLFDRFNFTVYLPAISWGRKVSMRGSWRLLRKIFMVDKDVFAVNIARLRLWLSLSVDGDKPKLLKSQVQVRSGE